jgi:hypothetical protein
LFYCFADIYSEKFNTGRKACQSGQKGVCRSGPKVSGFGVQASAIQKFQKSNHKYQTNHNDRNSKSHTVLVIEYWD